MSRGRGIALNEDIYFLREGTVDIDAAVIGIGQSQWIAVDDGEDTEARAKEIIRSNRFDVIPTKGQPTIRQYFRTDRWNDFTSISRHQITHRDVLPYRTHVRDVIKGFANDGRQFFFLEREGRIVGLVTIAHLNARQVKVYLFNLLSELEVLLGQLLSQKVSEDDMLALTFGNSDKEKYEATKRRYEDDKASGVEAEFVEYLYLADMISIVASKGLHAALGYPSKQVFTKNLGSLNELRHQVAHPTRSLVTGADEVARLWQRIDRAEEALFQLRLIHS